MMFTPNIDIHFHIAGHYSFTWCKSDQYMKREKSRAKLINLLAKYNQVG